MANKQGHWYDGAEIGVCSVGCGRGANADYVCCESQVGICVADGMGGAPYGDFLARFSCHVAMASLREGGSASDALQVARLGVQDLVKTIDSPKSGTTLTVVRFTSRHLQVAWMGDTACFVLLRGANGATVRSTLETCSPCEGQRSTMVEADAIMGFAVCTDGAWRMADDEVMAAILHECAAADSPSAKKTAARLAFGAEGRDDATAVVVKLR